MTEVFSIIFAVLEPIKDIAIFALVLSVLIVVHEWGHYITAKKCGVTVEQFALGFGKKLYSWTHNGTEFKICLIPLGGYVKMAGDERDNCTGAEGEFYSASLGKRSLIVLNGPVVNFILAYLCFVAVFLFGYPELSTRVQELIADHPAQEAGVQIGDEIVKVNGKPVYGFSEMQAAIEQSKGNAISLEIIRDGRELTKTLDTKKVNRENLFGLEQDVRNIGISPYSNTIQDVAKNSPAQNAGFLPGDTIVKVDGSDVAGWNGVLKGIEKSQGEKISFTVKRAGQEIIIPVTPEVKEKKRKNGEVQKIKKVGISPVYEKKYYTFGFIESLVRSWQKVVEITVLTYKAIYYMIVGTMSAGDNVAGIVGIYQVVERVSEEGFTDLLYIVGVISASLAIFNLLPIIPLDGGHLLLNTIEKIRGRGLSPKADEMVMKVGFSIIVCLALFVFYVDFERIGLFDAIRNLWQ